MKNHLISETSSLLEALHRLNSFSGEVMTLLAVDDSGKLTGTLTDGDVRRALIDGKQTTSQVKEAMHRNFRALRDGVTDVQAIARFRSVGLRLIPIVDSEGYIKDILDIDKTWTRLPMSAVLMAGGKGERLRPMTLTTPKPLLKIDGKAIIDYNVEALAKAGIKDIFVSTGYLANMLHEHFNEPMYGVSVKCIKEDKPMGTIGSVSLMPIPDEGTTLVMNSDLLTTVSFEEMYLRHIQENADITIAAIPYTVSVPYAILSTEGNVVKALEEKPTYSYYANAGIYIFSNHILKTLNTDERTDATDLIENTIAAGGKVVYYPINGTWIDVGSPVDFRQAEDLMRHAHNLSH